MDRIFTIILALLVIASAVLIADEIRLNASRAERIQIQYEVGRR